MDANIPKSSSPVSLSLKDTTADEGNTGTQAHTHPCCVITKNRGNLRIISNQHKNDSLKQIRDASYKLLSVSLLLY